MLYTIPLPQFTNREDFITEVSVFDDDTGDAINLAGITLANTAASFTGASWTVTDGAIVTASVTQITIPTYPIGNQLSALALTVGLGLGIKAGDPVSIKDPTGLNTMVGTVTSYNATTGALVCQIGMTFQFEIRTGRRDNWRSTGFTPWTDTGVPANDAPLLSASLGNGITITDLGFLEIRIPESKFRQLCAPGTYQAALTMFDGTNTRQVFVAELPVIAGGVTN